MVTSSSDVIGYGMVSYTVTPYADEMWRAMLSLLSRPAECGMRVDDVSFPGERLLHWRSMCLIPMNKASTEHPSPRSSPGNYLRSMKGEANGTDERVLSWRTVASFAPERCTTPVEIRPWVGLGTDRALFRAAVLGDTSTDIYVALELRDGDKLSWSFATPGCSFHCSSRRNDFRAIRLPRLRFERNGRCENGQLRRRGRNHQCDWEWSQKFFFVWRDSFTKSSQDLAVDLATLVGESSTYAHPP